ncbi:MAG TPA: GNAT family N-acetyltransferase, partial [Flavobacterium sp.]|nr:GNAT family N-acetyltransferase [Flavobacterium sp.]
MQTKIKKVELRNLQIEDYKELKKSMIKAYPELEDSYWKEQDIENLLELFSEGQLVIIADGKVVGAALSLIVDEVLVDKNPNYARITGNYTFSTHNSKGEILYGIDVFINPEYRGLRLGRRLYDARKELCEKLNLKAIVFAGRIPSYSKHAKKMTPKKYIDKVKQKELHDPVLSFQLSNDFHVMRIMKNYLEGDIDSKEFAVLLEWNNIYYEESPQLINTQKSVIRLG